MSISQQLTLPMARVPAIRRPAYPRPRRHTMRIVRIASALVLLAILWATVAMLFATPTSVSAMFDAHPTPDVAACARVTLIEINGKLTTQIDEVCQ